MKTPNGQGDDDPLAFMTTDGPAGWAFPSSFEMSRRAMTRGRFAKRRWQRILVWAWILAALLLPLAALGYFAVALLRQG